MRAVAPNPYKLVDFDRFGWSEPNHERRQRTRRREMVNTFLARRDYWHLMRWLSAKMPSHRRFLSIGEALALARLDYAIDPTDEKRVVVVVCKYFDAAGPEWL
jgi:hypothetical protein